MKTKLLIFALFASINASAADYYASPTGTGPGTITAPLPLKAALTGNTVKPGDTLWLRAGTYQIGGKSYRWQCTLAGTAAKPIIVRNYNNERAIIDGVILHTSGGYVHWWGLEITTTITSNRKASTTGPWPTDFSFTDGEGGVDRDYAISSFHIGTPGTKVINCYIHDGIGGGIGTAAPGYTGNEFHGNLIQYCGWMASDRTHGHGLYVQNKLANPPLLVSDNIILNNANHGAQFYGGDDAFNFRITGNVFADNGSVFNTPNGGRNFTFGSGMPTSGTHFWSNYTWRTVGDKAADQTADNYPGYTGNTTGYRMENNILVGTLQVGVGADTVMVGNRYYFSPRAAAIFSGGTSMALWPNNVWTSPRPTSGLDVFLRPNLYETNRANLVIYNWGKASTVTINVSAISKPGDILTLRNAQNYHGDILTRTNVNGSIVVPMTGRTVAAPIDKVNSPTPASTFPSFGTFVVIKGGYVAPVTPPMTNPCPPCADCPPPVTITNTIVKVVTNTIVQTVTNTVTIITPPPPAVLLTQRFERIITDTILTVTGEWHKVSQ